MDASQFRDDQKIDPQQLDVECVKQAERTYFWAQQCIEAQAVEDRVKLQLALTESRLEMECRQQPARFGLVRVTDPGVKAAVRSHEDMVEAHEKWIKAKRDSKLLDAAVKAMDDKKRMLQALISLHGQQYFAGPDVPRDLVAAWSEAQEGVEKRINSRQRKRTRSKP